MTDGDVTKNEMQLVKMFFHTYDGLDIKYQGYVDAVFEANGRLMAVCQLFSFIDGYPTDKVLFNVDDMVTPVAGPITTKLYRTEEAWNEAYQRNRKRA